MRKKIFRRGDWAPFFVALKGGGVVNIICIISKNVLTFNYISTCYAILVNILRTLKHPVFSHF